MNVGDGQRNIGGAGKIGAGKSPLIEGCGAANCGGEGGISAGVDALAERLKGDDGGRDPNTLNWALTIGIGLPELVRITR